MKKYPEGIHFVFINILNSRRMNLSHMLNILFEWDQFPNNLHNSLILDFSILVRREELFLNLHRNNSLLLHYSYSYSKEGFIIYQCIILFLVSMKEHLRLSESSFAFAKEEFESSFAFASSISSMAGQAILYEYVADL
jgi:hypothetical protein